MEPNERAFFPGRHSLPNGMRTRHFPFQPRLLLEITATRQVPASSPFQAKYFPFPSHGSHAAANDGLQFRFKFPQVVCRRFSKRNVPVDTAGTVNIPCALAPLLNKTLPAIRAWGGVISSTVTWVFPSREAGGGIVPGTLRAALASGSGSGWLDADIQILKKESCIHERQLDVQVLMQPFLDGV